MDSAKKQKTMQTVALFLTFYKHLIFSVHTNRMQERMCAYDVCGVTCKVNIWNKRGLSFNPQSPATSARIHSSCLRLCKSVNMTNGLYIVCAVWLSVCAGSFTELSKRKLIQRACGRPANPLTHSLLFLAAPSVSLQKTACTAIHTIWMCVYVDVCIRLLVCVSAG